jgi:hypothetical protein
MKINQIVVEEIRGVQRRGLAPLELVILMPLVAGLIFGLFTITRASLTRFDVIREARNQAWAIRSQTTTKQQMIFQNPQLDGLAAHDATKDFITKGWWQGTYPTQSNSRTLAGTWDHQEVPFPQRSTPFLMHSEPARLIAAQANLDFLSSAIPLLAFAMNIPGNPATIIVAAASVGAMLAVHFANLALQLAKAPLSFLRGVVLWARRIAQWFFQRRLARYLGKLADLMQLGRDAIDQLDNATNQRQLDWPAGGYDVWGLFP